MCASQTSTVTYTPSHWNAVCSIVVGYCEFWTSVSLLFRFLGKAGCVVFHALDPEVTLNKMDLWIAFSPFSTPRSVSDGTIVATRLTFCTCPVTLLWVALSIYFQFIKLSQLGVSANTTNVMAAHWAPVLEPLTKHNLIFALAYCAHPVCPLSLVRTRPCTSKLTSSVGHSSHLWGRSG